jgi:predicted ATPase
MALRSFLKSIRPVNLLSFGPNTEKIELRPLNILIGPNGSGKSNLIEVVRLLHYLPDKDPWSVVLSTGGVNEWIWKGEKGKATRSGLQVDFSLGDGPRNGRAPKPRNFDLTIGFEKFDSTFRITTESIGFKSPKGRRDDTSSWFERTGSQGEVQRGPAPGESQIRFDLGLDRSVLSQLTSPALQASGAGQALPYLFEVGEFFGRLDFHQDWEFGADLAPRDPIPVGQPVEKLDEDARNLAQMLTHYKDFQYPVFERINEQMKRFYGSLRNLDVRLIGTHLQVVALEEGGVSIPAYRLSDGTLRWLALLVILLNPTPAPVTCIEEPELGIHPDMIPNLADLLRDASERTQLIITTHSTALVDAFSDTPEVISVCNKAYGATEIRRLDSGELKVWLEKYSLGHLWASGEIGGNRW